MGVDDILDKFNLIDRAQGVIWGLTSWLPRRKSRKGRKIGKLRVDGGTREIRIDRMESTGGEAERALAAAHIPIAGRRITDKEAVFKVRARQAKWAELVLLRAGIQLAASHRMIDPKNVTYAANKGPIPIWGSAYRAAHEAEMQRQPAPGKPSQAPGKLSRAARILNQITED